MRDKETFHPELINLIASSIGKFAIQEYTGPLSTINETIMADVIINRSHELAITILTDLQKQGYFNKYID